MPRPQLDSDAVRALLDERGALLRPSAAAIDKAIERCRGVEQKPGVSRRAAVAPAATPPAAASAGPAHPPTPDVTAVESQAPPPPPPPPPTDQREVLPVGTVIGGYRIDGVLGAGGMGQVYRATQLSMNRAVALKVMAPKQAGSGRMRERFIREARAAGRLHHPNLIAVHDVGEADGRLFFSMELVEGLSLKALVGQRGRLPIAEALDYIRQALTALRYAHEHGVIHRDIKPDNLMLIPGVDELSRHGRVKIADLGLSRLDPERSQASGTELFRTQDGAMLGTPHYMAPEQGQDAHAADHRADLWAVGATLFHLVCAQPPFNGHTPMAVVVAAGTQPLVFPDPPPPAPVAGLIRRLMQKKPADRPKDAAEALALVDQALGGATITAPSDPVIPSVSQRRPVRRRRWRRWLAIAALLVALIAASTILGPMLLDHLSWQEERSRIQTQADAGHFREAYAAAQLAQARLDRIADAAPDRPLAAITGAAALAEHHRADAAFLLNGIAQAWNDRCLPRVQAQLKQSATATADGNFQAAMDILDRISADDITPEAELEIAGHQRAILEAQGRALKTVQTEQARDQERRIQQKLMQQRLAWLPNGVQPPASMTLREGHAVFTGTGSGQRSILPFEQRVRRGTTIRYDITAPKGRWSMDLGGDLRVVVANGKTALEAPGRVPIAETGTATGQQTVVIQVAEDKLTIAINGAAPQAFSGSLPSAIMFAWQIPPGSEITATVAIDAYRGLRLGGRAP